MPKYDHVIYALPDSGSLYEAQGLVLYPGIPVASETIAESFRTRLQEDGIIVPCSVEKNEAGEITGYSLQKKTELPDQPEAPVVPDADTPPSTQDLLNAQSTPADSGTIPPVSTAGKSK